MLSANFGVLYSDLLWGIKEFNLQSDLRRAARGRVLVLPVNAALQTRFVPLGLYKQLTKIPPRAIQELRSLVLTQLAVKRSTIPAKLGCGLIYVTHELGNSRRIRLAPPPQRWGGAAAAASAGAVSAAAGVFGTNQFSVLGQGYNCMVGLPISVGMSSLDPGFTLQPIFAINASQVVSLPTTGGMCTSQFSTSVYNTASAFKESLNVALGVGVDFGVASLSANVNFNQLSKTASATQTITTNSGAKVHLGGYGLGAGPAALTLDPAFIANAKPLFDAARNNDIDQYALQSFIDNYGTHYINTVYWGGLASVTSQMTASQYSSFQQTDVSVSVSAQVAMVQVNVDVDYSSTQTDTVRSNSQTFGEVLIPSLVNITLFNAKKVNDPLTDPVGGATYIDCVQWTHDIRTAIDRYGWRPPVEYTLSAITSVFTYQNIWPVAWRPYMTRVRSTLYSFIKTCGYLTKYETWKNNIKANASYTACPVVDTRCPKGTYQSVRGGCQSCYGDGSTIGPNCNATGVVGCTSDYCFCRPQFAPAARMYGCQPLRGDAQVDADENSYGVAFCPAGLVISNLINPTYGANGQYSQFSYVETYRRCIGHVSCSVQAANKVFGDPISGTRKRLKFTWECDFARYVSIKAGTTATLSCPGILVIGPDVRPYWGKPDSSDPKCNATGLYQKVYDRVVGRASVALTADTGTFNDGKCNSLSGDYYLGLHYTCNFPTEQTPDANAGPKYDGETLTIDCGQRRINDIIDARWTGDSGCGKDNIGADVTSKVRAKCGLDRGFPEFGNYGTCSINVGTGDLGSDPCSGTKKKLTFRYNCL